MAAVLERDQTRASNEVTAATPKRMAVRMPDGSLRGITFTTLEQDPTHGRFTANAGSHLVRLRMLSQFNAASAVLEEVAGNKTINHLITSDLKSDRKKVELLSLCYLKEEQLDDWIGDGMVADWTLLDPDKIGLTSDD